MPVPRLTSFPKDLVVLNKYLAELETRVGTSGSSRIVDSSTSTITNTTIMDSVTFLVPGTLVEDGQPAASAPSVILKDAVDFLSGMQAKVITAPTGSAITIKIGKTPAGGVRAVVATLTIAAGSQVSAASGALSFAALDTVDIQITAVGSSQAGAGLIVGRML